MNLLPMLLEYGDLMLAAIIAVAVPVAVAFGKLDDEKLTEATAALLGVLAFSLARERWTRASFFDTFRERLGQIERNAESAAGEAATISTATSEAKSAAEATQALVRDTLDVVAGTKPYHVLHARFSWEFLSCDGKNAKAKTVRDLRFIADNVFCIYEHWWASGKSTLGKVMGTIEGQNPRPLDVMPSSFPGPEEKQYRIIGLGTFMKRGQRMTIEAPRDIVDSFVDPRDWVNVGVESVTDRMDVELIWPSGCPPTTLHVRRSGSRTIDSPLSLDHLEPLSGGRQRLLYPVEEPVQGDSVFIIWEWNVANASTAAGPATDPGTERR
jgi:hypothetical protein